MRDAGFPATQTFSRRANPDGNGGFGILFNPSFASIADVPVADEENGGRLYLERERGSPVHGATITYSVFDVQNVEMFRVLFTTGDQMPFLPVTRGISPRADLHARGEGTREPEEDSGCLCEVALRDLDGRGGRAPEEP
jgi:hypothetical protein